MRIYTSILSGALLSALLLSGCSGGPAPQATQSASAAAGFPLTIDNCGHQLTFQAPPKRTVSLNQSSTEIQLSLGLEETMVGTGTWTDPVLPSLEAANEKVERLADNAPSLEAVVAKEPDFVTASFPSTLSDKTVASFEKFETLGVPAYAGWRSLAGRQGGGVLEHLLQHMQAMCPAAEADGWMAWLGPCIGPEAFEVGNEVREAFVAVQPDARACFAPAAVAGK